MLYYTHYRVRLGPAGRKDVLPTSWRTTQLGAVLGEAGTTQHDSFSRLSLKRTGHALALPCVDFGEDRLASRGVRRRSNPQSRKRGPERAERVEVSVTCSDSLPNFAATFTVGEGL